VLTLVTVVVMVMWLQLLVVVDGSVVVEADMVVVARGERGGDLEKIFKFENILIYV
jgi:hypothetical protein